MVSGLDPAQAYSFTCTFANALAEGDGAGSRCPASPPTQAVSPSVDPPPAPVLLHVAFEGDALRLDVAVAEAGEASARCSLAPLGAGLPTLEQSARLEALDAQGRRSGAVRVAGWVASSGYVVRCWAANYAAGRTPEEAWGPAAAAAELAPRPPAPLLDGDPVPDPAGARLRAAFTWSSLYYYHRYYHYYYYYHYYHYHCYSYYNYIIIIIIIIITHNIIIVIINTHVTYIYIYIYMYIYIIRICVCVYIYIYIYTLHNIYTYIYIYIYTYIISTPHLSAAEVGQRRLLAGLGLPLPRPRRERRRGGYYLYIYIYICIV